MTQTESKKHDMGVGDAFFSATDLNKYMTQRRMAEVAKEEARAKEQANAEAEQIKQLMNPIEITTERLATFMKRVRSVAEGGERQILILRFPSNMCTDSGRAINNALPGWEHTLVGVPRQLVDVWEAHLKSLGFRLTAEVLDYPNDMPGDIGLFCRW